MFSDLASSEGHLTWMRNEWTMLQAAPLAQNVSMQPVRFSRLIV
jgi:hypothetical protein